MIDTLRITFELEHADNPPLFEDLAKFPKGSRRVNRLRTLAHAGLLTQQRAVQITAAVPAVQDAGHNLTLHEASLELFGPSSDA
jgi:hypothetical protein